MKTEVKQLSKETEFALSFLCKRNAFDIDHPQYVHILMEFLDVKGENALQALAGFYCYAIDNLKGEKCTAAIKETFAHDLNGRNDKYELPRSDEYLEKGKRNIQNTILNIN